MKLVELLMEMGTAGYTDETFRSVEDVITQMENLLNDNGITGQISAEEASLINIDRIHSPNDDGFNDTIFDILSRRLQGDYSWEEKDAIKSLKDEISRQAVPDEGVRETPPENYGTRAEAPALDYEEPTEPTGYFGRK